MGLCRFYDDAGAYLYYSFEMCLSLEYIVGVVERVIFSSARDFVLERHRVFLEEFLCRVVVYLFTVLVNRFPLLIFTTFSSVTFALKSLIVLDF